MKDSPLQVFVKTRIDVRAKDSLEAICSARGVSSAELIRGLILEFLEQEKGKAQSRFTIDIWRPEGYQTEVQKIVVNLRNPSDGMLFGHPVPFILPVLEKRRLNSDAGFQGVYYDGTQVEIGGQFANGVWRGHVYSNGCLERDNPTSIEKVRESLSDSIMVLLHRLDP